MLSEIHCIKSVAPNQRLHMVAINFCHLGDEPNSHAQCDFWKKYTWQHVKINFKIVFFYNFEFSIKMPYGTREIFSLVIT